MRFGGHGRALLAAGALGCSLVLPLPGQTAEAVQPPRSPLEGVVALNQPVSYTETKIPLSELVARVAADTGVPLTASAEVADEPVDVVVKRMPARELLEQLADLLDYRWARRSGSRSPNTEHPTPTYEIDQDLASKQREAALRAAAFAAAEGRLREEIRAYAEMARLSEKEIQTRQEAAERQLDKIGTLPWEQQRALLRSPERWQWIEQDQRAKTLSRPIVRTLAALVGQLSPEQWSLLRTRHRLVFSSHPERGELPLPARFIHLFRTSRYQGSTYRIDGPPGMLRQMSAQFKNMQSEWDRAAGYRVILQYDPGQFMLGEGLYLDATATPLPSPRASLFQSGNRFIVLHPGELDWLPSAQVPEERPLAEVTDALFGRKATLVPQAKPRHDSLWPSNGPLWQVWDLLPDLARTYNVQFISDAYWSTGAVYGLQFPAEEQTLINQLARATGGYYRWDRRGDLIRLRSKNWFLDRRREIPLRLASGWQKSYARYGEPTFEQYVNMAAALTDLQLHSTKRLIHRGVLPAQAFGLEIGYVARWPLRFYALLSPVQERTVREGKKLSGLEMSPRQRALFRDALEYNDLPPDQTRRPVPIHWEKAAFSLSSAEWVPITEDGGSGTERVSAPYPGAPRAVSREPPPPRAAKGTLPRSSAGGEASAPSAQRRPFCMVYLDLDPGRGKPSSFWLSVAAPSPATTSEP